MKSSSTVDERMFQASSVLRRNNQKPQPWNSLILGPKDAGGPRVIKDPTDTDIAHSKGLAKVELQAMASRSPVPLVPLVRAVRAAKERTQQPKGQAIISPCIPAAWETFTSCFDNS